MPAATATISSTKTTPATSKMVVDRLRPVPVSITSMRGSLAKALSLPPSSSVTDMAGAQGKPQVTQRRPAWPSPEKDCYGTWA